MYQKGLFSNQTYIFPQKVKGYVRKCFNIFPPIIHLVQFCLDHTKALKEIEAIKSQSEGLSREYDRLMEEHDKVSKKLAISEGGSSTDKKDD